MIKVFGHLAPDTDATGSALIWAWYLNEVQEKAAQAFVLGEPNSEAMFVLKRWGFDMPPLLTDVGADDECVVCDTNNPAELPPSINTARVAEVIDHHMLAGGLKTASPIKITIRPVASTATVMHWLIGRDMDKAPDRIKGLILSCILSDTLEFRSPTTTPTDRKVAEDLAADLKIDIPAYAAEMFEAKSDITAYSDEELLRLDSKIFNVGDKALRVSVLETTSPKTVMARKDALVAAMPGVAQADKADEVLLFVVDILSEGSTLLVPNDMVRQIAEKSFGASVKGDTVVLPGVVSRKKQIVPALKV